MNRNLIIAIIAVLAIGGGYYQFSYKPAQEMAAAKLAEAEEAAKKAADEAAAAAKAAEEAAAQKAAEVAAAAEKAAADAAAAATAAATEAANTVTAAAGDLMAQAATLLDPANFDATKVAGLIDAAPLDDATKTTLKGLVTAAGSDTGKIGEAISAIKAALKM